MNNDQKIEKLLDVLRKQSDSMASVKEVFKKDGDEHMVRFYEGQITQAKIVIMLLTNDNIFDKFINIYLK